MLGLTLRCRDGEKMRRRRRRTKITVVGESRRLVAAVDSGGEGTS